MFPCLFRQSFFRIVHTYNRKMISKLFYYIRKCVKFFQSVDKLLEKFFRWYGYVVYDHKWIFLILPIIFTLLTSCGFYFMESLWKNSTEYVFTPFGSQSEYEKAVITEQFPLIPNHYMPGKFFEIKNWLDVIVKAKDGGNLLRPEYVAALNEFNKMAMYNFTVLSYDGRFNLTFQNLCLSWEEECYANSHLNLMENMKLLDQYIPVTYPVTRQGDVPIYVAGVFGGVNITDNIGRFNVVSTVRLSYHLIQDPVEIYFYAIQWRNAFQNFLINDYHSDYLDVGVCHADSITEGLQEIANTFWPQFLTTFSILSIFCVVCSFVLMRDTSGTIDWVRSKPAVAVLGIISACMAIATGMGLCFIFQQDYNQIVNTMPFLALSIGVNDMFIMTNGWHRTKIDDPVGKRLSEMMSEAAVAITITSFTDVFSFLIGTWNNLRAVIMFCEYTAVALLFDYIYQITFYSAAIAIYGDLEREGRHCLFFTKIKPNQSLLHEYFFNGSYLFKDKPTGANNFGGSKSRDDQKTPEPLLNKFFRVYYGPFLMHPLTKSFVVVTFIGYLAVSIYGCSQIKDGLQPDKLVLRTHYVHHYFDMMSDFWGEGLQAQVVVNNPPNITNYKDRIKLLGMVNRFENGTHTLGKNATIFFLREYINYLDGLNVRMDNTSELWQDQLQIWLKYTGGRSLWLTDIKWGDKSRGEDPNKITCFRFQIGIKNFQTSSDAMETVDFLRSVCDFYPEYNVTTFQEYWPYVDQYEIIKPTMLRDNITAIFTMLAIALVLIPNVLCGIFITAAMITINVGIYGFMSLWGVNLDCVSMITLIMAIGFAIDLSCHICYAYICSKGTPTERTVTALEQLGWPVFQGATATILGVLVLGTVDSYLVQTFFKTVFLVILFGLLHSIVFLPVSLALFLPEKKLECCKDADKDVSLRECSSNDNSNVGIKVIGKV